ncbi:MAG: hypothetical protein HKO03_09935 [Acidimicrobiia bacterium]|nr:hypothetical protein [Acidimicrobiia bacterium]
MRNTADSQPAGGGHVRPPMEDAGVPRPTVRRRRTVRAVIWDDPSPGFSAQDDYVRRFWTAVIGPGAVADLLRLMAAAGTDRELKRPVFLAELARVGLARDGSASDNPGINQGNGGGNREGNRGNNRGVNRGVNIVSVRSVVPPIPEEWVRKLPTAIRQAHAEKTR